MTGMYMTPSLVAILYVSELVFMDTADPGIMEYRKAAEVEFVYVSNRPRGLLAGAFLRYGL
jgi:hypothetical protein